VEEGGGRRRKEEEEEEEEEDEEDEEEQQLALECLTLKMKALQFFETWGTTSPVMPTSWNT